MIPIQERHLHHFTPITQPPHVWIDSLGPRALLLEICLTWQCPGALGSPCPPTDSSLALRRDVDIYEVTLYWLMATGGSNTVASRPS